MKPTLAILVPSPTLHPDAVARPGSSAQPADNVGVPAHEVSVLDDSQLMLVGGGDGIPCW